MAGINSLSVSENGFSMIELMIVLAIIGILTAVFLPEFKRQSAVSRRIEGVTFLHQVLQHQLSQYAVNEIFFPNYVEMGMLQDYFNLKAYKIPPVPVGCDADGPMFVATEICIYQDQSLQTGFSVLLVADIDQKNEGGLWNEDILALAWGRGAPAQLKTGVVYVFRDDLLD